jgi:phenylalanyl-tRNA synthetase beta chain
LTKIGLGREYTKDEFEDLCFAFGIELDDVVEEIDEKARSRGENPVPKTVYKIDMPANRYDLLCLEGLVNALNVFNGKTKVPVRYVFFTSRISLAYIICLPGLSLFYPHT